MDQDWAKPGVSSWLVRFILTREAFNSRMTPSEAASLARIGLKVLGLAAAPISKRPPGLPGSHWAIRAEGGKGWPAGLGADCLPQPARATSNATNKPAVKFERLSIGW